MKRVIFSSAAAAALLVACGGGGNELAPNTSAAPASSNAPVAAPVGTSAAAAVPVATAAPVVPSAPVAAPVSTPVAAPIAAPAATPVATPATPPVVPPAATPAVTPVATPAPSSPAATQPVPAPVPAAPPAATGAVTAENSCALPNFQASVLLAVNAARAQARTCGNLASPAVAALGWNQALMTAAASHSLDMAQRNYFSHTSPEGATTAERAQLAGYPFVALGENIAAGQSGVESVMKAWLGSPGHCLNIMSASYTDVAVACVSAARQQYPTYWTMVLGKRP